MARALVLAAAAGAGLLLPPALRAGTPPRCGGVAVLGEAAARYRERLCAVLARAGGDAALVDVVYVAPADGAGMRQPVNPEGGALNCGEAPRGERVITLRDHPACALVLNLAHYAMHELGHKRWEFLNPGEGYGPRWREEEAYAEGYADGSGHPW